MLTKLSSWLSLFALLALFTFEADAQAPAPAAPGTPAAGATTQLLGTIKAARVVNKVTYENIATGVVKDLVNGMEISQGNIVRTDVNSSVVLMFSNGASINLAFSSELNIETFTQNPFEGNYEPAKAEDEPSVSTTNLRLTKGELIGNVKKLKRGGPVESRFTVGTPVGAAGIRGTTFKITYRPSTDGRTFTFTMTTIEGRVEVTIGSGTVNALPASVVTNNQEIVLNNVEVNTTTNVVTATTSTGQTVAVTAPPPAVDAPVGTVAQVTAVATQLAQAVANVVFVSPTLPAPTPTPVPPPAPAPQPEEKKETPPPPAPPVLPPQPQVTNPR